MNKPVSILIFGGGMLQCSLIRTAKRMGLCPIVIDPDPNAIGKQFADKFYIVGSNDFEKTLEVAKSNQVKGLVTAATDKPLLMMARVAKILDLPFPSENSISDTIDKFKLKQILVHNHLPCAKGVLTSFSEINHTLNQGCLRFPLIIKPIDSSGSRGVFFCKDKQSLVNSFQNSLQYSKSNKVLVEEFIEGPEISVEALVQGKKLHIIQITDKTTTPFPYNVEMAHQQPSRFSHKYFNAIKQLLETIIESLKLDNCALHPEIKISKDGIKIIEIGPRLGGDFITSHLTPLSTGIDMEEQVIKIAIGEKINTIRKFSRFSTILYFNLLSYPLDFDKIKNLLRIFKDNVRAFEIYYSDISNLPVITNSLERHGHIVFYAETIEELISIKERIVNYKKQIVC